jgi:Tfp pilus assembly protein PilO
LKKRDIGILIGLGLLVLLVAWYFLIIGPKRDAISTTEADLQQEKKSYEDNTNRVRRLDEERNAARQTSGEILKLNKLIPVDAQVPSLIVELQQTANEAGIKFIKIEPSEPTPGGDSNTIVPFSMVFQGNFFDVNDFLYRVENYARMEGNDVNVSGRLLSVVSITLDEPDTPPLFPQVKVDLGINAYMTNPPPVTGARSSSSAAGGGAASGSASNEAAAGSAGAGAAGP